MTHLIDFQCSFVIISGIVGHRDILDSSVAHQHARAGTQMNLLVEVYEYHLPSITQKYLFPVHELTQTTWVM